MVSQDKDHYKQIRSICVFGGTLSGRSPLFAEAASIIGKIIGDNHIKLVFGGGSTGMMSIVANAVLHSLGYVVGIIPRSMKNRSDILSTASEIIVAGNMHDRRMKMYELSDAFIALPGGLGTLEETVEVLSWLNLNIIDPKPLILVDINHYWDSLMRVLEQMIDNCFVDPAVLTLLTVMNQPADLLSVLDNALHKIKIHSPETLNLGSEESISDQMERTYFNFPSQTAAFKLQKLAADFGFDWKSKIEAIAKVYEELHELANAVSTEREEDTIKEYGDVVFALINLSRHLGISHDHALDLTNQKFKDRFKIMQHMIKQETLETKNLQLEEMLSFWEKAKLYDYSC